MAGKTVLLIAMDSIIPNLALMKASAWHKQQGDCVEIQQSNLISSRLWVPDVVYISCIFKKNKETAIKLSKQFPHSKVLLGGSGVDLHSELPPNMEHIMPDYDGFGCDHSMGFATRGCIRHCDFCIVPEKEGKIRKNADIYEFWNPKHKKIVFCDNNILALPDHFCCIADQLMTENLKCDFNQGLDIRLMNDDIAETLSNLRIDPFCKFAWDDIKNEKFVRNGIEILKNHGIKMSTFLVLIGFNSAIEEDFYRINTLRDLGQSVFAMWYQDCPVGRGPYKDLIRWTNFRRHFFTMTFEEYLEKKASGELETVSKAKEHEKKVLERAKFGTLGDMI